MIESQFYSRKTSKNFHKTNYMSSNKFPYSFNKKTRRAYSSISHTKKMTKSEYLAIYDDYQKNKQTNKKKGLSSKISTIPNPDFDRYQPTSPNPKRSKSPGKHRKNKIKENTEPDSPSKLEKPLISFFFKKIIKAPGHENPSKTEVLRFLVKNPRIMELYGLTSETLNQQLRDFSMSNFMNFEEFSRFLKTSKEEFFGGKPIENTCLMSQKDLDIMHELFKEVDAYKDGVISRFALTEKIRNDKRLSLKLDAQAVYHPAIDKILTLNQILKQIEQEAFASKGQKNYMSWEEFQKYFNEHKVSTPSLLSKLRILKAKTVVLKTENDENVFDLDRALKNLLHSSFNSTNKKKNSKGEITNYVNTFELIENIRGNPEFYKFEREIARKNCGFNFKFIPFSFLFYRKL